MSGISSMEIAHSSASSNFSTFRITLLTLSFVQMVPNHCVWKHIVL